MSITKSALFKKAKPRYEVVDVPGFGKVGIQSVSKLRQSMRESGLRDPGTGELLPDALVKLDAYALIDQVMKDDKTPLFEDSDLDEILTLDAAALAPLFDAIARFNLGESRGKQ